MLDLFARLRKRKTGTVTTPVCYAPYSIAVYERFLSRAVAFKEDVRILGSTSGTNKASTLYIRHDIDRVSDMDNLPLFVAVEKKHAVVSAIYVMANGNEYKLENYRTLLVDMRTQGFEIGLHTVCYAADDYMDAFKREIATFSRALGFPPTTFTVHGLGDFRLDVRNRFITEISDKLDSLGLSFSDAIPSMAPWRYCIHDCHADSTGRRYIRRDFTRHMRTPAGTRYLLLTHPGYWMAP